MLTIEVRSPTGWHDYELLDSGNGARLERYGPYTLVRPEPQATWRPHLPQERWDQADAIFRRQQADEGRWQLRCPIPEQWPMQYGNLTFYARLTPFRHTGVFPEQAEHWRWIREHIQRTRRPVTILNLFGYTGLTTLAAAAAGATVCHLDASPKIIDWARENQAASGLAAKPVRWIADDALKFVRRESRRGVRYDGIVMDPPAFGRGPKGEVWKIESGLPALLEACREVLAPQPLFFLVNAYAIRASALMLYNALGDILQPLGGHLSVGELVLRETTGKRPLSTAIYGRWSRDLPPPSPLATP
jgi:23S rRNA (cytosine1962-C5)-methyltransferase